MDRLDKLLEELAPRLAALFREAIQAITDNALLKQVEEAIARQDYEAAFRALDVSPVVFNPLLNGMQQAFEAGAFATIAGFPQRITGADGIKTMIRFNIRDRRAEDWLRDQSSQLVTTITEDIRLGVRETMSAGLSAGRNPRNVALDIVGRHNTLTKHREGGVVGLGEREQLWANNVEMKLRNLDAGYFDMKLRDARFDATVRQAIENGTPLPESTIEKLLGRYRDNALKHRGETIARTETIAALNRSEWLATKQAVESGDLRGDAVKRVWDSAGDRRTRPSHREMDGQTVGLNEPFVSPDGRSRMMHPGDISLGAAGKEVIGCRCRVRTVVDWFAGVS